MIEILDYKIIATGSSGNAVRIKDVLVDCGVPFKHLKEELRHISVMLITHTHSDHIMRSTFDKVRRMYPHITVVGNYAVAYNYDVDVIVGAMDIAIKDYVFTPFECPHDVPCTGYVWEVDGKRLIYATDTAGMDHAPLGKYDYFFLESNHDEEKIKKAMGKRIGAYDPYESAKRHLSTQECKLFYYMRRKDKDSKLIELHQSKRFY